MSQFKDLTYRHSWFSCSSPVAWWSRWAILTLCVCARVCVVCVCVCVCVLCVCVWVWCVCVCVCAHGHGVCGVCLRVQKGLTCIQEPITGSCCMHHIRWMHHTTHTSPSLVPRPPCPAFVACSMKSGERAWKDLSGDACR